MRRKDEGDAGGGGINGARWKDGRLEGSGGVFTVWINRLTVLWLVGGGIWRGQLPSPLPPVCLTGKLCPGRPHRVPAASARADERR